MPNKQEDLLQPGQSPRLGLGQALPRPRKTSLQFHHPCPQLYLVVVTITKNCHNEALWMEGEKRLALIKKFKFNVVKLHHKPNQLL